MEGEASQEPFRVLAKHASLSSRQKSESSRASRSRSSGFMFRASSIFLSASQQLSQLGRLPRVGIRSMDGRVIRGIIHRFPQMKRRRKGKRLQEPFAAGGIPDSSGGQTGWFRSGRRRRGRGWRWPGWPHWSSNATAEKKNESPLDVPALLKFPFPRRSFPLPA